MLEHSALGYALQPALNATTTSTGEAVTFAMADQWPFNDTFTVGYCSGELVVSNPEHLILLENGGVTTLYANVSASINGQPFTSVYATISVHIIETDDPPVFTQTYTFNVDAGAAVNIGYATATDPENNATLVYAITFPIPAPANMGIDAVTGMVYTTGAGLAYSVAAPYVDIQVTAYQQDNPSLLASTMVTININNVRAAPVVANQAFTLDENSVVVGTLIPQGLFMASDSFTSNIIYQIVNCTRKTPGKDALAIAQATGQLSSAITYNYASVQPTIINGVQAKDAWIATVQVCDSGYTPQYCANATATV